MKNQVSFYSKDKSKKKKKRKCRLLQFLFDALRVKSAKITMVTSGYQVLIRLFSLGPRL